MDEKPSFESPIVYKKSSKRPEGIIFLVLLLITTLILLFLGLRYINSQQLFQFGTQEAPVTPTRQPERVTPSQPEPSPTPAEEEEEDVDRAELTVDVQNGSGTRGAASELSAYLEELGYEIGTVGNADAFDYEGVTIQIKKSKGAFLPQLKKDIEEEYTVTAATTDLSAGDTADAVVIYGKE